MAERLSVAVAHLQQIAYAGAMAVVAKLGVIGVAVALAGAAVVAGCEVTDGGSTFWPARIVDAGNAPGCSCLQPTTEPANLCHAVVKVTVLDAAGKVIAPSPDDASAYALTSGQDGTTVTVVVANAATLGAAAALHVSNLAFSNVQQVPGFTCSFDGAACSEGVADVALVPNGLVPGPGQATALRVSVRYKPILDDQVKAVFQFDTTGVGSDCKGLDQVTFLGSPAVPNVTFVPAKVQFGGAPVGACTTALVALQVALTPIDIKHVEVHGPDGVFEVRTPKIGANKWYYGSETLDSPTHVGVGESVPFEVRRCQAAPNSVGFLRLQTAAGSPTVQLTSGKTLGPDCFTVGQTPDRKVAALVGSAPVPVPFVVHNCSARAVPIDEIKLVDATAYTLVGAPAASAAVPYLLGLDQDLALQLLYAPKLPSKGGAADKATLAFGVEGQSLSPLNVTGFAMPACPVVNVSVAEGVDVPLGTLLHFTCPPITPVPSNWLVRRTWTAQIPFGAPTFQPDPKSAAVALYAGEPGLFTVCCDTMVDDVIGWCGSACTKVTVK